MYFCAGYNAKIVSMLVRCFEWYFWPKNIPKMRFFIEIPFIRPYLLHQWSDSSDISKRDSFCHGLLNDQKAFWYMYIMTNYTYKKKRQKLKIHFFWPILAIESLKLGTRSYNRFETHTRTSSCHQLSSDILFIELPTKKIAGFQSVTSHSWSKIDNITEIFENYIYNFFESLLAKKSI